jgi:hypothetical protein
MATTEYTIDATQIGAVLGPGFIANLELLDPPVYETPAFSVAEGRWSSAYLTLRDGNGRNVFSFSPISCSPYTCVGPRRYVVYNGNVGYPGDLHVTSVPAASRSQITLSDQPNP